MSLLTQFNNQLSDLIKDLIYLYPGNKRFVVFNQKLLILRQANPRLIIEKFIEFIYPFKKEILSEDDKYFTKKSNDDNIKDIYNNQESLNDQNYVPIEYALNLKDLWLDMSQENKDSVWKYFKVLIILCEKWIKKNYKK